MDPARALVEAAPSSPSDADTDFSDRLVAAEAVSLLMLKRCVCATSTWISSLKTYIIKLVEVPFRRFKINGHLSRCSENSKLIRNSFEISPAMQGQRVPLARGDTRDGARQAGLKAPLQAGPREAGAGDGHVADGLVDVRVRLGFTVASQPLQVTAAAQRD